MGIFHFITNTKKTCCHGWDLTKLIAFTSFPKTYLNGTVFVCFIAVCFYCEYMGSKECNMVCCHCFDSHLIQQCHPMFLLHHYYKCHPNEKGKECPSICIEFRAQGPLKEIRISGTPQGLWATSWEPLAYITIILTSHYPLMKLHNRVKVRKKAWKLTACPQRWIGFIFLYHGSPTEGMAGNKTHPNILSFTHPHFSEAALPNLFHVMAGAENSNIFIKSKKDEAAKGLQPPAWSTGHTQPSGGCSCTDSQWVSKGMWFGQLCANLLSIEVGCQDWRVSVSQPASYSSLKSQSLAQM